MFFHRSSKISLDFFFNVYPILIMYTRGWTFKSLLLSFVNFFVFITEKHNVCPRSFDTFNIVTILFRTRLLGHTVVLTETTLGKEKLALRL